MENSSFKGPFNLGEIVVNQTLLQKEKKSFEEIIECKCRHAGLCKATDFTAFLTGSEAGSVGSGSHEVPAKKCTQCNSNANDSSKKKKTSNGWY